MLRLANTCLAYLTTATIFLQALKLSITPVANRRGFIQGPVPLLLIHGLSREVKKRVFYPASYEAGMLRFFKEEDYVKV